MVWTEWVAIIASILTIVSVCINIIQWDRRRSELKSLRSQAQASYNFHYITARACTQARHAKGETTEERLNNILCELKSISGVSDTARNNIIAFSREHLNFLPFYEHPAYPGKDQPDEVKMGVPPEEIKKEAQSKVVK